MNDHRVALKLAVVYTVISLFALLLYALAGDERLLLRAAIHAAPGAVLWGGWLWMRATA